MKDIYFEKKKKIIELLNTEKNGLIGFKNIYKNCEKDVFRIYWNVYKVSREQAIEKEWEDEKCCKKKNNISYFRNGEEYIKRVIEKGQINAENDRSSKKSVDLLIFPCIYEINKCEVYFTTSTCSGRILIFGERTHNKKNIKETNANGTSLLNIKFNNTKEKNNNEDSEEEAFLNYFKEQFFPNTKKNRKKEKIKSSQFSDYSYPIGKNSHKDTLKYCEHSFPCSDKKKHKKNNITVYYVSHTHQSLEIESLLPIKEKILKDYFALSSPLKRTKGNYNEKEERKKEKECSIYHTYDMAGGDEVLKKTETENDPVLFLKFEPFIIHVACANLAAAFKLLKIAQYSGLKNSGILNDGQFVIVAIRGSHRIEHFIGNLIHINKMNLSKLLKLCNEKMNKNCLQFIRFYRCYKQHINSTDSAFCNIRALQFFNDKKEYDAQMAIVEATCKDEASEKNSLKTVTQMNIPRRNKRLHKQKDSELFYENNETEKMNIKADDHGTMKDIENVTTDNKNEKGKSIEWERIPLICEDDNFHVWGHDMFVCEHKIYLFGGFPRSTKSNKLFIYDLRQKKITSYKTELPALVYHSFLNFDNKYAFLFGGRKCPNNCSNKLWIYNMKTNVWILAKIGRNLNEKIDKTKNVVTKNKHGIDENSQKCVNERKDRTEIGSDDERDCFLKKDNMSKEETEPCGRYRHSCVCVNVRFKKGEVVYTFYMYGGTDKDQNVLSDMWEGVVYISKDNEAYVYWNKKNIRLANNSLPLHDHTMVFSKKQNLIFILGGYGGNVQKKEKRYDSNGNASVVVSNEYLRNGSTLESFHTSTNENNNMHSVTENANDIGHAKSHCKGIVEEGYARSTFEKNEQYVKKKKIEQIEESEEGDRLIEENFDLDNGEMTHLYVYDMKKDIFYFVKCTCDRINNSFPLNRFSHSTCLINNKYCVLFGGLNKHKALTDLWILDLKKMEWHFIDSFSCSTMYIHSKCKCEDDILYIVGGGCTIFTFGSFFSTPVFAACKQLLLRMKKRNSLADNCEGEINEEIKKDQKIVQNKKKSDIENSTNIIKEKQTMCSEQMEMELELELEEENEKHNVQSEEREVEADIEKVEHDEKNKEQVYMEEEKHIHPEKPIQKERNLVCKNIYPYEKNRNWLRNGKRYIIEYVSKNIIHEPARNVNLNYPSRQKKNRKGCVEYFTLHVNEDKPKEGSDFFPVRDNKQLCVIVKNASFVKEVKVFLEKWNYYDASRKIRYGQEKMNPDFVVEGYFIPITKKIERTEKNIIGECIQENEENSCANWNVILDKLEKCKEGILYCTTGSAVKKTENMKQIISDAFEHFANTYLQEYFNNSEKELFLNATKTYELIGTILIFHYCHLKPLVQLYHKKKMYLKKCTSEYYYKGLENQLKKAKYKYFNSPQEKKRENEKCKYELKNYLIDHILLKYECKKFVKRFHQFWNMLKKSINSMNMKWDISTDKNETDKNSCYITKRNNYTHEYKEKEKKLFFQNNFCNQNYEKEKMGELDFSKMKRMNTVKERKKKRIATIAVYKKVKGELRENKIFILCGKSLKTIHKENNILYKLDLKKCMFSSGNGTEKQRMKNLYLSENTIVQKENVVDLFCGIGYFTLSLIKYIGDKKINHFYACDKNPYSLELLKESIALNKIKKQNLHIIEQDSFLLSGNNDLVGKCHRVLLGLLPTSEGAWINAFHLLDRSVGGVLHIHGIGEYVFNDAYMSYIRTADIPNQTKHILNSEWFEKLSIEQVLRNKRLGKEKGNVYVDESSRQLLEQSSVQEREQYTGFGTNEISNKNGQNSTQGAQQRYTNYNKNRKLYLGNNIPINLKYAQYVLLEIYKIALRDYVLNGANWIIRVLNVEKVKSYAPRLFHFVVDVKCTPELC